MAESPMRRVSQAIESDIDELDLIEFAADDGSLIWDHLQAGGEVIIKNPNTKQTKELIRTSSGFAVI